MKLKIQDEQLHLGFKALFPVSKDEFKAQVRDGVAKTNSAGQPLYRLPMTALVLDAAGKPIREDYEVKSVSIAVPLNIQDGVLYVAKGPVDLTTYTGDDRSAISLALTEIVKAV